jgi:hypothetical protein
MIEIYQVNFLKYSEITEGITDQGIICYPNGIFDTFEISNKGRKGIRTLIDSYYFLNAIDEMIKEQKSYGKYEDKSFVKDLETIRQRVTFYHYCFSRTFLIDMQQ